MSNAYQLRNVARRLGLLDRIRSAIDRYNRVRRSETYVPPTDVEEFRDVQRRSLRPTDLSDHVERMFTESLRASPNTIVELGVRGGESTFVFERVARLVGADLVSVDVDETTYSTDFDRWRFVRSDDVEFAAEFEQWCDGEGVDPTIDVLFVDTSHRYEHTVREIEAWFPHLADDATVFFHDTNMRRIYRRKDGTIGTCPVGGRGVIRAIEEYFGCNFDETESFLTVKDGFVFEQYPTCSGFGVLRKLPSASSPAEGTH
ncbi:class I SAM-dependent methyltransferase [Halobium palmae]|uniref:Class I SAM-dependent methyltransferase n=1 Tax=Halobium palmae TaxID=1776492 RepID=A0ABD5RYQ9_9EURY